MPVTLEHIPEYTDLEISGEGTKLTNEQLFDLGLKSTSQLVWGGKSIRTVTATNVVAMTTIIFDQESYLDGAFITIRSPSNQHNKDIVISLSVEFGGSDEEGDLVGIVYGSMVTEGKVTFIEDRFSTSVVEYLVWDLVQNLAPGSRICELSA